MDEKRILNLVLVEPRIPQNTGNVARTCACTGCRLHLVGPMAFKIDDAKLRRAGLDYWQYLDITYYEDWADFVRKNPGTYWYFTKKASRRHVDIDYHSGDYLVFGREDLGLPESILALQPDHCVRFPMRDGCRSLNLSNAVAIGVYEALRQWDFPQLQNDGHLEDYLSEET